MKGLGLAVDTTVSLPMCYDKARFLIREKRRSVGGTEGAFRKPKQWDV
jgi:hypothetical protein